MTIDRGEVWSFSGKTAHVALAHSLKNLAYLQQAGKPNDKIL